VDRGFFFELLEAEKEQGYSMLLQPCLTDSNINCTPLRPQVNSCGLSGWFQEVRNSNAGTSASWLHHGEAGTG